MKASVVNTHMGNISIDNEVIAQYAGAVAMECFGIVGMASRSMKDGLAKLLRGDNVSRGVTVKKTADGLIINFHIRNLNQLPCTR